MIILMNEVYEVWMGWRNNNEDCYFKTADRDEAIERAEFYESSNTKEEIKNGLFVEVRVYLDEYNYAIIY